LDLPHLIYESKMKMLRNSLLILFLGLMLLPATAQEPPYVRSIFSNSRMTGPYYFSEGRYEGGSQLALLEGKLPVDSINFHTPGNSLRLSYTNAPNGNWYARIRVKEIRGQDHFEPATHLSFYVRYSNRLIPDNQLPQICLEGSDGKSGRLYSFTIRPNAGWQLVRIPLDSLLDRDLPIVDRIKAIRFQQKGADGFAYSMAVDDIELITPRHPAGKMQAPLMPEAKAGPRHFDLHWPLPTDSSIRYVQVLRSTDGSNYEPIGVQFPFINRYTDFVGDQRGKTFYYKLAYLDYNYQSTAASPAQKAMLKDMDDNAFLDMIQEAHFRYYWEMAEPNSGLAFENIPGRRQMIASGASGFGLMALLAGAERKFITREQVVERFIKIVNFLEQAETFHGAYSHFIDGPTGKVEPFFGKRDNGGDLVETSFLAQGLLAARNYFTADDVKEKLIRDKITSIWERIEWSWYRKEPDSKFLFWHWSPDQGWVIKHRLIGWNETMITYFLAIASPTYSVPPDLYYSGWANQDSTGQQYRINWGGTTDGSMYTNGNSYYGIKLDVGVSNGGPLFFTHYSYLGLDPHAVNDKYTNYFDNNQAIARINYEYCVTNPGHYPGYGESCWGLTASDGPEHYSADEPVLGRDKGKIAPTGAIASFPYTPEESMRALKNYYYNYGHFLWGEYGFRDAFNLKENWCSEIFMGLNQAPIVVMIENYRSGLLWKLFMKDVDVEKGVLSFK
jgi:hypothetical protein